MSGDDVRVFAAHLCDLATRHARMASDAAVAARSAEGLATAVENTHGEIAAAIAALLGAALDSRERAAATLVNTSAALSAKLADAAARYEQTDEAVASALHAQMPADRT